MRGAKSVSGKRGQAMSSNRTALLIRCSREEAETIRAAAQAERRTVSGFVLHAVMNRIANLEKVRGFAPPKNSPISPNLLPLGRNSWTISLLHATSCAVAVPKRCGVRSKVRLISERYYEISCDCVLCKMC